MKLFLKKTTNGWRVLTVLIQCGCLERADVGSQNLLVNRLALGINNVWYYRMG